MSTILMMIDGLRPDAIDAGGCSNLQAFRSRSSYTMQRTVRHAQRDAALPHVDLPQRAAQPSRRDHQRLDADGASHCPA